MVMAAGYWFLVIGFYYLIKTSNQQLITLS